MYGHTHTHIYVYIYTYTAADLQLETILEKFSKTIAAKWYLPVSKCTLRNQASQHLETNYHICH